MHNSFSSDDFASRHLGPSTSEIQKMLQALGRESLDALIDATIPSAIRAKSASEAMKLPPSLSETQALAELRALASQNRVCRTFIGMGYYPAVTPPVIQRNILENPGWYTQYTPYQAEISQGRLEALLNFQTLVSDLTALPVANASLLDEATAAAEAMTFCHSLAPATSRIPSGAAPCFFVAQDCHPQTIAVVRTRAEPLGIEVRVGDPARLDYSSLGSQNIFGILLQYPGTDGAIHDPRDWIRKAHDQGALVAVATDLLALTLLTPPGELGADVAIGSSQRFGVPLGFGGPHAAFFSTREEFKRRIPGRIIGVSRDAEGRPAYRLALQTREQHIRRDKATSNICTAQVLLAVMASMYAVYHGPERLKSIARRVMGLTQALAAGLTQLGVRLSPGPRFDTLQAFIADSGAFARVQAALQARAINLRVLSAPEPQGFGVSLDETTTLADVEALLAVFAEGVQKSPPAAVVPVEPVNLPAPFLRQSAILAHPVFNRYHSETEMLRYIRRLESRDLSLTTSMIPLGSCTMKLNATAEMFPVSWPEFSKLHPFVPADQARGYARLISDLERDLAVLTGFDKVSLQPNSGAQGEYAGLLVIRKYHQNAGQPGRNVCLIPKSAHGTNPASAALAGMRVVVVECDASGNVDVADLQAKAQAHAAELSALMITYPSTHGVFEGAIREICEIVHRHGGQVYMDGANLNAQIGLCLPGQYGPDVCHLNLHKTFCIPHGGGGPGMGPIAVRAHLADYLPGHPVVPCGGKQAIGPVSAAPWGSPSILTIPWMYNRMMGASGLTQATRLAILNANYVAHRLHPHYPVLYKGEKGCVAHECIIDLRPLKAATGVEVEDVAKRLMDYGYHAPTISFPVPGTMMIEPTESEGLRELDRFCDAMISIRQEIAEIESGRADRVNNLLKNAPHTATAVTGDAWDHPYSRARAAFPSPSTREHKFWPSVARIDNVAGDRNLVCSCPPIESY